jgi:transposase
LSRLPLSVDFLVHQQTGQGDEVEREHKKVLQQPTANRLDLAVSISSKTHRARLVAVRVSKQEAKKRRRERNVQAKAKGKSVSQKSRTRDGWHLMATNVKSEIQSVEELCEIYRQRWQIEIVFRAWKQSGNLRSALNRVSSEQHLKGLMLAGILLMAMSLQMGM